MEKINFDVKIIGDVNDFTLSNFIDSCKDKNSINVLLYSSGGSGEAAFGISDYVKSNKINMYVYCIGKVESAALIILNAGIKKYAFGSCVFMYHTPTIGTGTIEDHEKHLEKFRLFLEMYKKIIPKSIQLSQKPTYITVKQALKLKVINKIL